VRMLSQPLLPEMTPVILGPTRSPGHGTGADTVHGVLPLLDTEGKSYNCGC
jgi:hypothetical protein